MCFTIKVQTGFPHLQEVLAGAGGRLLNSWFESAEVEQTLAFLLL